MKFVIVLLLLHDAPDMPLMERYRVTAYLVTFDSLKDCRETLKDIKRFPVERVLFKECRRKS